MKNQITLAVLFSSMTLTSALALAVPQNYKATDASVEFNATGKPSLLKIKGTGAKVAGQATIDETTTTGLSNAEFTVELNEFDTGISMRDKHMKEKYLETGKFPEAKIKIEKLESPKKFAVGTVLDNVPFTGTLTLKGATKPIHGTVSVKGNDMTTDAQFAFNLSDFPLGVPSYAGITVADQVNVHVSIPKFVKP